MVSSSLLDVSPPLGCSLHMAGEGPCGDGVEPRDKLDADAVRETPTECCHHHTLARTAAQVNKADALRGCRGRACRQAQGVENFGEALEINLPICQRP